MTMISWLGCFHLLSLAVVALRMGDEDAASSNRTRAIDPMDLVWSGVNAVASNAGQEINNEETGRGASGGPSGGEMFPMMNQALGLSKGAPSVEVRDCEGSLSRASQHACEEQCIYYFGYAGDAHVRVLECAIPTKSGVVGAGDSYRKNGVAANAGDQGVNVWESCCFNLPGSKVFGKAAALTIQWCDPDYIREHQHNTLSDFGCMTLCKRWFCHKKWSEFFQDGPAYISGDSHVRVTPATFKNVAGVAEKYWKITMDGGFDDGDDVYRTDVGHFSTDLHMEFDIRKGKPLSGGKYTEEWSFHSRDLSEDSGVWVELPLKGWKRIGMVTKVR